MIGLIGVGGIAGTLLRFYLGKWVNERTRSAFPWGTWIINISGSLLLGILYSLHARHAIPDSLWLAAGTGFCGGYTTFSTFGYETSQLVQRGKMGQAAGYVATSVLLGVAAAYIGMLLAGWS